MASPRYAAPPGPLFQRVASINSTASSGRDSRVHSPTTDATSVYGPSSSESPRSRYQDRLQELAVAAGIPLALPKPLLSHPSQRAVPQSPCDKAGAEEYLMSLRPKKFLVGKSSKGFSRDEIMLGLDQAVKANKSVSTIEALLQFAESSAANASDSSANFTASKKGPPIPTINHVFGQVVHLDVWHLFLGRVSQRARDNALAGALRDKLRGFPKVRLLLEWGANPELCQDRILELISSPDAEELVESILLSPSLGNSEFLSQALIQSTSCHSLRLSSMLLLRGADANFSHGDALRKAVSAQCYDIALALVLLSKRPVSSSILDDAIGSIGTWHRDDQKRYLLMLLYAGACGLRTSRAVTPHISGQDREVTSVLIDSIAFGHGSFPASKLFQAAVETRDTALAIKILQSSRNRSFSDYASTGVHLKLVQSYAAGLGGSIDVITELLTLGTTGDYTSQMLVKCCEAEQIDTPNIMVLMNLLIQTGGAKVTYADGRCLLLAIEAAKPAVVKALVSGQPTQKMLNAAIAHTNFYMDDGNPLKLEIWSTLVQAGASGEAVDQQLVMAIDGTPQAMDKVMALLPAASLDHSEGEAMVKAIQLERLDILQACIDKKKPQTSMSSIWKQTRRLFDITGGMPYSLVYMQRTFNLLSDVGKHPAFLNELLLDATQCRWKDIAFALTSQFIRWGASPDHALGAPLIACVKRSDSSTLGALLSQKPAKTSLKYAFEEVLSLRGDERYKIVKMIIEAGLEKDFLDAALPEMLRADTYESSIAHLVVARGARLHSSFGEHLIPPAKALDLQIVETLIPENDNRDCALLPLKTVLSSWSDWQRPDGQSLPMVKFLLTNLNKGTWADRLFISQTKTLNQHAANLFIGHLTTKQIVSDSLHELLSQEWADFSREKLSMTSYLLKQGAEGDIIDTTFLLAAQKLECEWVKTLSPRLYNPTVRLSAFEMVTRDIPPEASLSGKRFEIVQFLSEQGLQARAVEELFIKFAAVVNIQGLQDLLPYISDKTTFSKALSALNENAECMFTEMGRVTVRLLIENGASGDSVLNYARAAARANDLTSVKFIIGASKLDPACRAAFKGLMDNKEPLTSHESRAILRYLLIDCGLDTEDAETVARLAASKLDIDLMKDIEPANSSGRLYDVALATLVATKEQWLSGAGLSFLEYLLGKGMNGSICIKLLETAVRAMHLPAIRLLQTVCGDKEDAANIAFAALVPENKLPTSAEGLAVMELLLEHGAKGVVIQNAAAAAAETSNYDALEVFLKSRAASSIIPAAFKAVTRTKLKHLSSEELSIASILVKHGVPTDVLAIAAIETVKLLDLEALKVLSQSPRFRAVTDDTLRKLLLDEDLWRSLEGIRIMQYLFGVGVSLKSTEAAASKVAVARDIDALQVVLESNSSPDIVNMAFQSMIGNDGGWLSPDGLRMADLLIQKGPLQSNVDKAFIQASQYLSHDAVQLLYPYITDVTIFGIALEKTTSTGTDWLSELHLIERLLNSCVDGDVIESALIRSAQALDYGCLKLLSAKVDRWEAYTKALAAVQTNKNWRQSTQIIQFLLTHGAHGQPVEEAFITAAGDLDYHVTVLLAGSVDNADVDCQAFSAAVAGESWLLPGHINLLRFLYQRGLSSNVVKPALISAAKAFNLPAVEVLAKNADEKMASAAFASAFSEHNDWMSPEGSSVLKLLVQRGARGAAVDQALVSSTEHLRLDLIDILHPNVDKENIGCFSSALDAILTTNDSWLSRPDALDIIQIFIDKGAVAGSASKALVLAAQNGNLDAVNILKQVVDDPVVYTEAFNALTKSGSLWLLDSSHELLELLLSPGSIDEGLHRSLISATQEAILGVASVDLLVLLLEHGANTNYGDGRALEFAVKYGRIDLVELFLRYGPNSTTLYVGLQQALCSDHNEQTALDLLRSIAGNNSLDAKPDVNHDSNLGSPLIFYCLKNYPSSPDLARKIIDLGGDMSATIVWSIYQDEPHLPAPAAEPIPPLLFALHNQVADEVIVDVLCNYGQADYNHVLSQSQASALVLAARMDRQYILSTLLDLGARVAQQDCFGRTALFYAGRNGNVSALTSLLKKKPPTNDGSLHEAARELSPDAVKMLVAAGHDIDYPSLKHGGRNPLCELCLECKGSRDPVALHDTLLECMAAKASPLRKFRGKSALFFAIDNPDPLVVVSKVIEVCLWKYPNDPSLVFEQGILSYSATMYIKKGISNQPEKIALGILDILQDASMEDRYYAKERMPQPKDAVGMPQRIADLDRKKWIRSNRLEEEQEDHQQRLRREMEEMDQRNQLSSSRHLLTMEQREDLARQTSNHNSDAHWQAMQFRSLQQDQAMRYRDQQLNFQTDEMAATHRVKQALDQQVRDAQLQHDKEATQQMLGHLGEEQSLRLDGAQAQQQLKLGGISAENTLKNEHDTNDLRFKSERSMIDRADMDHKLQHHSDLNADKISTLNRLEDLARSSQQRKNDLDDHDRQSQLQYLSAHDELQLRTEATMNRHRQEHNSNTLNTRSALNRLEGESLAQLETDRDNQLQFHADSDRQRLNTLSSQGLIENNTVQERAQIENNALRTRYRLVQGDRDNELRHGVDMGDVRLANEISIGQRRLDHQQASNQLNRNRLMDDYQALQAGNLVNGYGAPFAVNGLGQVYAKPLRYGALQGYQRRLQ